MTYRIYFPPYRRENGLSVRGIDKTGKINYNSKVKYILQRTE